MTKIKCLICGDILEGDRKGTFIQCKCKSLYIDEIEYYCRVSFKEKEKFEIIEEFEREEKEKEKERNRRNSIKTNKNKRSRNNNRGNESSNS